VVAHDGGGEIMRGMHKRAIVDEARLLSSAAKRNGSG
jgi:predicted thioesterase